MNKSFRDLLVSEDDEFGETLVIIDGEEGVPGDERFENVVGKINAAFNARVDEEVKEAVEESEKWRRAAILLGERIGTVGPNGYYSFTADQFFEWVKGLPTEPKP